MPPQGADRIEGEDDVPPPSHHHHRHRQVLELTSRSYETGHCHTLILRAHGSLLRGVLTYRKSYVKPVAASAYNDASIAARPDILSGHEELVQSETGAMNRDFHALVNATDVLSLLLDELEHRAGSYRR